MQQLTQEFVDQAPVHNGFRLRGLEMTRIEVFIDAAFAFAVTMLVISYDVIPANVPEMILAIKGIPAFAVAVAQLVWIWHEHNVWSRRYGLDDGMTVVLSTALLVVVLVYIYPLRVMAQGMFGWLSGGYLPSGGFDLESLDELRFMFVFLGFGFTAMCLVFYCCYRWARHRSDALRLSAAEAYLTQTIEFAWLGSAFIALSSLVFATVVPEWLVPFSGFAYMFLGLWLPMIYRRRNRGQPD